MPDLPRNPAARTLIRLWRSPATRLAEMREALWMAASVIGNQDAEIARLERELATARAKLAYQRRHGHAGVMGAVEFGEVEIRCHG